MMRLLRILSLLALSASCALRVDAQEVTLPLAEYDGLRARANPAADPVAAPPAPFALELAEIGIKVAPESARVTQTLRFTLYDDEWRTLPLGEAGSMISADFGGGEGRVETVEKGWALQVRGRGRHEVKLESVLPVTRDEAATRPTWRFALRAPAAAVVRGRLEMHPGVEDVETEGSAVVDRNTDGSWRFAMPAGVAARWTLSGRAVVPRRAQLPLRFEATSATASTLTQTRFRVLGWVQVRVAQGRLEELRIPIPAGLKVAGVQGPVEPDWRLDGETLVLKPLAPVEDSLAVEVNLTGEPRDKLTTPLLIPEGSARTALFAKAYLQGDGILSLADRGAARVPDDREAAGFPESLKSAEGRLFAVTDAARPPTWEAAWSERTEMLAAQIDRLVVDVAAGEAGRASYQLWAEVRNRGAQQLSFTLPPGFELVEARRDGAPVIPGVPGVPGASGTSSGALAVPLLTQEAPQVVYLLGVFALPLPPGEGTFEVPLPALSAPAGKVEVRVILPGGRSYELTDASRAGSVAPPPRIAARQAANAMAQQVAWSPRSGPPLAGAELFPCPPGFVGISAAWSALSANPSALSLRAKNEKEKVQWF